MQTSADRELTHLYPDFQVKVMHILAEMTDWCNVHKPGYKPLMVEGFRRAEYQYSLWMKGRNAKGKIVDRSKVVTYKDGFKHPSNHQSGLACDIVAADGSIVDYDDPAFFKYLGHCAREVGLTWGGDWKGFQDSAHVEFPTSQKDVYTKAKAWLKIKGLA